MTRLGSPVITWNRNFSNWESNEGHISKTLTHPDIGSVPGHIVVLWHMPKARSNLVGMIRREQTTTFYQKISMGLILVNTPEITDDRVNVSQQVVLRNLLAKKNSFCFYLHCCGWRYPSIYRLTYIALSDIVLFVYFDPLSKPWFLFNLNGVWIFTSFVSLISSKRSLLPYCFQFSWNGWLFFIMVEADSYERWLRRD